MLTVLLCNTFLSFLLLHAHSSLFPQPVQGPCPRPSSPRWTFLDFPVSCFSSTCTPCPFVLLGIHLSWSIICTAIFSYWYWDWTRNDIPNFSGGRYNLNSKIYVHTLKISERIIKLRRPKWHKKFTNVATYFIFIIVSTYQTHITCNYRFF